MKNQNDNTTTNKSNEYGLFDSILLTFKSNIPVFYYRKKFLKLTFMLIFLIFLSSVISFFVLDIGRSSSQFGGKSFLYSMNESPGYLLKYFFVRQNAVIIYYIMIALLVAFNILVIKRIMYLWICYKERYNIETTVICNEHDKISQLKNISKSGGKTICTEFISTLYNSFNLENSKVFFPQFYQAYLNREEDRTQLFLDGLNKSIVWIIRMGIFGTLLGMMIAFFELWHAMDGIIIGGDQPLTQKFIDQIKMALMGNAIAVATSITAHGAALILEVGVTFFLRDEDNTAWIHRTFYTFLEFEGFATKPDKIVNSLGKVNLAVNEFRENINALSNNLGRFNIKTELTNKSVDTFIQLTGGINSRIGDTSKELQNVHQQITTFKDHLISLNKPTGSLSTEVSSLSKKVKELNRDSKELDQFIKSTSDSINLASKSLNQFSLKTDNSNDSMDKLVQLTTDLNDRINSTNKELKQVNIEVKSFKGNMGSINKFSDNFSEDISSLTTRVKLLNKESEVLSQLLNNALNMMGTSGREKIITMQKILSPISDAFTKAASYFNKQDQD